MIVEIPRWTNAKMEVIYLIAKYRHYVTKRYGKQTIKHSRNHFEIKKNRDSLAIREDIGFFGFYGLALFILCDLY